MLLAESSNSYLGLSHTLIRTKKISYLLPLGKKAYNFWTLAIQSYIFISSFAYYLFAENWSNAQYLTFSIYNSGEQLTLYYRVHEWKYRGKSQDYSDRYNGHSEPVSEWNTIEVEIKKIESGPENRKTDINHIRCFGFFVTKQPSNRVLYVDRCQTNNE